MEVRVYLPPCYLPESQEGYPVLYLIHGMNNTEEQWIQLGVDEVATQLIQSGEVSPFIIVMPRDRLWEEPSLTPFDEVFIDELIPWVETHYAARSERAFRAVGGLSRGGMWAIHFGFGNWDLFGAIGGHSAPVFWEDARLLKTWLDTIPSDQWPRIYLDIGEKDYLSESNTWLVNLLNARNIPHEHYLFPGYHEDSYWAAHVETYLRWYSAEW
jgi:enterochelin esterase-like enzyme